jgi:membrane-bound inhibitor of C-type lysozyme
MKLTTAALAATVLCLSTSWALAAAPAKVAKKAAPLATLAAASPEQMEAAGRTLLGPYDCEFNQTITVAMNDKSPGYVNIKHQKAVFTMKPVQSSTGALRLEDVTGKTLWIQIANKSMLMDQKAGRRIVDGCVHASQREAAAAAAK